MVHIPGFRIPFDTSSLFAPPGGISTTCKLKECLKESFGTTEYVYGLIDFIRTELKKLFMFLITKVNNDLSSA